MSYRAMIHLPREQKDVEHLMHEIALFRAEKTLKLLREWGVTPEQLTDIMSGLGVPERKQNSR